MNVTFRLPSAELEKEFLSTCESRGLCTLKGHRSVGGIRASIYNAMPIEGVSLLADTMEEFAKSMANSFPGTRRGMKSKGLRCSLSTVRSRQGRGEPDASRARNDQ